jgi:hypothetical protein
MLAVAGARGGWWRAAAAVLLALRVLVLAHEPPPPTRWEGQATYFIPVLRGAAGVDDGADDPRGNGASWQLMRLVTDAHRRPLVPAGGSGSGERRVLDVDTQTGRVLWPVSVLLLSILEPGDWAGKRCLELGSGTGAVGLALAQWGADVVLTGTIRTTGLGSEKISS